MGKETNNNKLILQAGILSQIEDVKPFVIDNIYRAIEDLDNGKSVNETSELFVNNINDGFRLQYFVNKFMSMHIEFVNRLVNEANDAKYLYHVEKIDASREEDMYSEEYEDWYEGIKAQRAKVRESISKTKKEITEYLIKSDLLDPKYVNIVKEEIDGKIHVKYEVEKNIQTIINDYVDLFIDTQTRGLNTYNLCKQLFKYSNKLPYNKWLLLKTQMKLKI